MIVLDTNVVSELARLRPAPEVIDWVDAQDSANVVAMRTRAGRPISGFDAQIAAVCAQHGATLATRNLGAFDGLELNLINPWNDQ